MSKQQEHIDRIRKEKFWIDDNGQLIKNNPLVEDLMNSIRNLSNELYAKDTHFIFELIQNAEDNQYNNDTEPSLIFKLTKNDPTNTPKSQGALIVCNNEIGFSSDNINAICSVGKTTKNKIQGYIGEKGIGFKSVFKITTTPHIFSNGYQFSLPEKDEKTSLGYIVPQWVKEIPYGVDPEQTTIILPLDKPDFGYKRIKVMLQDIKPETILFLSKLKKIQIITDDGDTLTISKDDRQAPLIQISIGRTKDNKSHSEVEVREFLLFSETVDRPQDIKHEKRIGINKRDIFIAFSIDNNKETMGKIFAYLPIRSDTGFPFIINADFILPSSREDIQDVPWNRWLIKCIANLLANKMPLLKERNLLTVQLLEALAKRMNEVYESNMFYPIVEAVHKTLLNQELLPANDGTFVSAKNAKLARGAELRELLTHDQLRSLFQSDDDLKWSSKDITQNRSPELYSYLTKKLNIDEVTPYEFAQKISDKFLEKQDDNWMIRFYKFISNHKYLWENKYRILQSKQFIRLKDGTHVKPFNDNGLPNAYLPLKEMELSHIPVVRKEITENQQALEFFREIGISEPDVFDDIMKRVLTKYKEEKTCYIKEHEHDTDIKEILRVLTSNLEKEKEKLIKALKTTPFLKATNQDGISSFKKPSEIYFPTADLKTYFNSYRDDDVWFLAETIGDREWELLGVSHKPRFVKIESHLSEEDKEGLRNGEACSYDIEIIDYDIDGLTNFLNSLNRFKSSKDSYGYSLILWNFLINYLEENNSYNFYNGEYIWFYYTEHSATFEPTWKKKLMTNQWLPKDNNIGYYKPIDLFLEELPKEFTKSIYSKRLAELIGMRNDVIKEFLEKNGYELVPKEEKEEFEQWKATVAKDKEPAFPTKTSADPERRQERVVEQLNSAPEKKYEQRKRSVRISANTIDKETYLRNAYTNDDGQMICQICKEEMPFKKRNGEYYFEAVEALSRDYFAKEHEAQFLALCPLCAAMYKEFVKPDEGTMEYLKNALINSEDENREVQLKLGDLNTSVRFVDTHWNDIRTILVEYNKSEE